MQKLSNQKFREMMKKDSNVKIKRENTVNCIVCGAEIQIVSTMHRNKYCSKACKHDRYADNINTDTNLRDEITRLYMDGKSVVKISKELKVNVTYVQCFKKKYLD